MNPTIFSVIAFGSIFLTGIIGGLIPLEVPETEGGKRILSIGNALAGGIFLGAALIHLWPASLERLLNGQASYGVEAPFLLSAAGFLLVLFLEKVLLSGEDVGAMAAERHPIYPYVLMLVLSVHSIIAGTTLGLEGVSPDAVGLLIAILAHKAFAGIALGISLYQAGFSRWLHVEIVTIFAMSTPAGFLIGRLLTSLLTGDAISIFIVVFSAFAAGTFLYVALMDIISETFEDRRDRYFKFLFIVLGLLFMYLLTLLE